ncbi:hypothetical protein [Paenibacillus beijingensis]|uniref:hypothetical protein n=1 Tax=Paenibacillus beijingensis TaxID=1126833 RepID=UPI0006978EFB|nr:hypothetical protein [Paenibacillus beijingensis]
MNNPQAMPAGKEIDACRGCRYSFSLQEKGFVELDLKASSASDWREKDRESAFVRLYVNGVYNQDIILFYGNAPFVYQRMLGCFEAGEYELYAEFRDRESAPLVTSARIERIDVRCVPAESPLASVYRHTPLVYGRNLTHPYESRFTDTPLLLFYSLTESGGRTVIEYQMMFSHEDEGTPGPLLMSKWGRTTDIEWMYRVELDSDGQLLHAEYQGPHHVTTPFRGGYELGGHPVLQAATGNGNFTDEVRSGYCYLLPPLYRWQPQREPRERVMDHYPFAYQVTNWEMQRQYELEQPCNPESFALADQRSYLFVQTSKHPSSDHHSHHTGLVDHLQDACLDIQVRLEGSDVWYSSSFHDLRLQEFRAAYQGPYSHFATTVKLPKPGALQDVAEIRAVLLPDGAERMTVSGLKAFMLGDDYLPLPGIESGVTIELTREEPNGVIWKREEGEL